VGDWDFLHEMRDSGYSAEEIADAAACGLAPWHYQYIDSDWLDDELEKVPEDDVRSLSRGSRLSRAGLPFSMPEQAQIFEALVDCARRHYENTGRYLQIWGELGEIYAEIRFGLRRHGAHEAGSDGKIRGKLVEVKTISPEKASDRVMVKSQGDFEQLLVIRIDRDFVFKGKLFERCELKGGAGKYLRGRFDEEDSEGDA
jgi:hypothetical protein